MCVKQVTCDKGVLSLVVLSQVCVYVKSVYVSGGGGRGREGGEVTRDDRALSLVVLSQTCVRDSTGVCGCVWCVTRLGCLIAQAYTDDSTGKPVAKIVAVSVCACAAQVLFVCLCATHTHTHTHTHTQSHKNAHAQNTYKGTY